MKVMTVCSGIGAPEMAWAPLGMEPIAFSEIEPFPCQLLKHYYPKVPNYGDMSDFKNWPLDPRPDLLCGGTPCQSYSVAGLRKGLDDPRGSLMLTFVGIAAKYRPRWLVWENVAGVLSSEGGRDFAQFLGLLTGQRVEPPPNGWQNSGTLPGIASAYGVAWRILDAQYSGVPQRRRRVFLVGYLGDWRRAAAVLFEREGMRGDPPPSRKPGKGFAPDIAACLGGSGQSGGFRTTDLDGTGAFLPEISPPLRAQAADPHDDSKGTYIAFDARTRGDDGRGYERPPNITGEITGTLDGHKQPCLAFALRGREGGALPEVDGDGTNASALRAASGGSSRDYIAFKAAGSADFSPLQNCAPPITASGGGGSGPPCITYTETAHCLNAGGMGRQDYETETMVIEGQTTHTLKGEGHDASEDGTGRGVPLVPGYTGPRWAVRRLTPRECERLMGFPDDYTLVPGPNGKPASDSPRYKSLGNSIVKNELEWIGKRILEVDAL